MRKLEMIARPWHPKHDSRIAGMTLERTDHGQADAIAIEGDHIG
jgi:hypothetical protein